MLLFNEEKLLQKILEYREQNQLNSIIFLFHWPKIAKMFSELFIRRQNYMQDLTSDNALSHFFYTEIELVCLMNITIYEDFDENVDLNQYIDRNLKYANKDYFECVLSTPNIYQEVSMLAKSRCWQTVLTSIDF